MERAGMPGVGKHVAASDSLDQGLRPDWLKAWRNEANYLLFLARRASDDDNLELLQELEEQARDMADMVEVRWRAEGL